MANLFDQFDQQEVAFKNKGQPQPDDVNLFDQFDPKTGVEAELESGNWTNLDQVQGAGLVLEGMTLGWSDELITAVGAVVETATSDTGAD